MEDIKIFWDKIKKLYKALCQDEWSATTTGIVVALLTILIMAWWRPWGAVGAIRNWGDWMLHGVGIFSGDLAELTGFVDEDGDFLLKKSIWYNTGSVIGLGLIGGAFISACLGGQFAFRFPPVREYVKAMIAGVLMGIGAALAGGCNVGGMYNAIGNLAANGFAMWVGLIPGALFGLWLLYKEMEHISWGGGGSFTLNIPYPVQFIFGVGGIGVLIWGAAKYAGYEGDDFEEYIASLSGLVLIATGIGYAMQRGRWCMIQGFREPHMTGDSTMARSVALSILIVAIGAAVLKYGVPARLDGEAVLLPMNYVRGTFGWGGVVGGFIFGVGAMMAGGCGSGTLWRVGEGQIKLWLVVPFFGISNSLVVALFKNFDVEANGWLGKYVYMPDVFGYGYTLGIIVLFAALWYLIVSWNEDSNKLLLPM
ncbi:YeeE/YedE thiosulfate transporter family protein [Desulfogranum marinum]|uniref:YeeE/YedE thiosulfate transporter family protein n=1 Tax=Desulfogranum marinum TaxID=453220 RepID=UPI001966BB50|nr:YeeE/YedE thiosulfate transporter family protein [Desulfogranum marinum]MBM9512646.1 YeeE/YedE family protein [Desulfogranum marinum]